MKNPPRHVECYAKGRSDHRGEDIAMVAPSSERNICSHRLALIVIMAVENSTKCNSDRSRLSSFQ